VNFSELIAQAVLLTRSDAIIAADRDGIIRFWNPGAERIFGHVSGEAIGRSLDLIIPERLRQRHWDGFRHTMETGHSRYGEGDLLSVPALRKDGTTISVEFTIVLLKTESVVVCGIVAIMRDVTQRFEEMRHLRRKLAASGHAADAALRNVMKVAAVHSIAGCRLRKLDWPLRTRGAEDEERIANRIAEQEQKLAKLIELRALARN
jgi:PAS domain S-box-containing protein